MLFNFNYEANVMYKYQYVKFKLLLVINILHFINKKGCIQMHLCLIIPFNGNIPKIGT